MTRAERDRRGTMAGKKTTGRDMTQSLQHAAAEAPAGRHRSTVVPPATPQLRPGLPPAPRTRKPA